MKGEGVRASFLDRWKIINFILIGLLLVFIVRLLNGDAASSASVEEVAAKVTAAASMDNMRQADSQNLKKYYQLSASDYDGVAFYLGNSNMDVEEILIVRMKDTSQADALRQAMEKRVSTQKQSFEGYGVSQTKLLEDSVLDIRGNYALLVINEKAQAADAAFRKSL
jgi:hypothetical protein